MKVKIGGVTIGDGEKIAVQSMCDTKTTDIDGSIAQILNLEKMNCDIIRLSVPDKQSAVAIKEIIKAVHIPVVADIHFDYKLAIASADAGVSKIRINPGNIGDAAKVKYLADYLKERNIPIRIGVNAGSLEKEFVGLPLPEALTLSALKHVKMLEDCGFYNTVISVKSSNVADNVAAYRLLKSKCNYPLHVGVTEAGIKEVGIIKSAIGIGSLLLDGIGDTIRVSLTDDPVEEIKAAHTILASIGKGMPQVEVISCPTCARTEIDVKGLATSVWNATRGIAKSISIAVMGCIVNGPGEAGHCDFGIAGGKEKSAIFKDGKVIKTVPNAELNNIICEFIAEI